MKTRNRYFWWDWWNQGTGWAFILRFFCLGLSIKRNAYSIDWGVYESPRYSGIALHWLWNVPPGCIYPTIFERMKRVA